MRSFRFRSLASGSAGNATLIEAPCAAQNEPFRVLVDCGLNLRQLRAHLHHDGLDVNDIQAIFVTHEHSDHVGACFDLAARLQIPVWSSYGTWHGAGQPDCAGMWQPAYDGQAILWGDMSATPFTVPHDSREPLQLVITHNQQRLALLTDLGHVTEHVLAHVRGCHAILLEFNHDPDLLQNSRYPAFLKRRISGRLGHLSNAAAAALLREVIHPGLHAVVAGHLSKQNNQVAHVQQWMQQATQGYQVVLSIASQELGSPWVELPSSSVCNSTQVLIEQTIAGILESPLEAIVVTSAVADTEGSPYAT
ncbi:MBL fold metallo-hydrolase [Lampropedia puyangensis]|uniref:MBL fold metallo-hydrolase n=1 Tax=Lampropedia puyangensis TaxID=1330072 RepID=A0A4S8FDN0_9BURK|nr:MBL fold metallo-hydrolase [Lampropedia puyangensis]THU05231.1 MBL fold metallo-hydrolase [Lampropedia puyangensis]